MTRERAIEGDTPFGQWLRSHPALDSRRGFDCQNLDYIWHHFIDGHLMLLEEKCFNGSSPFAQRDTHSIIDQALAFALTHPAFTLKRLSARRPVKITYHGYHLVVFERTSPLDGRIWIDGREVTPEQLLSFLKFEWTPGTKEKQMSVAS